MYKLTPEISEITKISVATDRMMPSSIRKDRSLCSHSVASATAIGSRRLNRDFMDAWLRKDSLLPLSYTVDSAGMLRTWDGITGVQRRFQLRPSKLALDGLVDVVVAGESDKRLDLPAVAGEEHARRHSNDAAK